MTQTPLDLDTAIDAVAKQLTHVEHDPHLSTRIATSLPERSSWSLWRWSPQLAAIAFVVAAGMFWANREQEVTHRVSPLASAQPIATPILLARAVKEAEPNRTPPLQLLEPLELMEPTQDFERALSPIAALESLELSPLTLADLPLTADPISPR